MPRYLIHLKGGGLWHGKGLLPFLRFRHDDDLREWDQEDISEHVSKVMKAADPDNVVTKKRPVKERERVCVNMYEKDGGRTHEGYFEVRVPPKLQGSHNDGS